MHTFREDPARRGFQVLAARLAEVIICEPDFSLVAILDTEAGATFFVAKAREYGKLPVLLQNIDDARASEGKLRIYLYLFAQ